MVDPEPVGADEDEPCTCADRVRLQAEVEHLKRALATRDTIGAAVGILMAHQACGYDQAFEMLRRASMRENRKISDIAMAVVSRRKAG